MQTYHTLQDMRVVFLDGTVLDTADLTSRQTFLKVRLVFMPLPAAHLMSHVIVQH